MQADSRFQAVQIFDGASVLPGRYDVTVGAGRIAGISPVPGAGAFNGSLLPGIVDAHVHVSFSSAKAIVAGGVTEALDLGEPVDVAFDTDHSPLRLRTSGPIITARGGYPTQSWGAKGYGLEIDDERGAREAVARLADRGAAVIKVAIQSPNRLDAALVVAVAEATHARGLAMVAHALSVDDVEVAATCGVDALAHTPIEPLTDDLVRRCSHMTVISTVKAFGGATATVQNLRQLAAAGCRVVYGTDLGNEGIRPGVDAEELAILESVLGSRDAALKAATTDAAAFAGFPPARIEVGAPAKLIHVASLDYADIAKPLRVLIDGKVVA